MQASVEDPRGIMTPTQDSCSCCSQRVIILAQTFRQTPHNPFFFSYIQGNFHGHYPLQTAGAAAEISALRRAAVGPAQSARRCSSPVQERHQVSTRAGCTRSDHSRACHGRHQGHRTQYRHLCDGNGKRQEEAAAAIDRVSKHTVRIHIDMQSVSQSVFYGA